MKQFQLATLRSKLIFSFLAVALFPLLGLAWLNQQTTQKVLMKNANQTLLSAASQTALSVDTFITTNLDAIRVEAQLPVPSKYLSLPVNQRPSNAQLIEDVLRALSRKDTLNILSYALLDRQGKIVVDTYTPDVGKDSSNQDYFQQPLKTGLPFVSSVQYSSADGLASLYFSSPVRDASGQIIGVLRVRYNAVVLQRILSQNSDFVGGSNSKAFAILLDENYIRLAQGDSPELILKSVTPLPPDKVKALQTVGKLPLKSAAELSTNLPEFKQGLDKAASSPFFTAIVNPTGNDIKAAAVIKLKTKPWYVVFADSESVFLAPIQAQLRDTLLLAFMIAGVVVIAATTMSQLLAKPLVSLAGTVTEFTAGNLTVRALVASNDEIGILASSFNRMAQQVGKLLRGLEERTDELEISQHMTVAVSELSRSLRDPEQLLQQAVILMQERFGLHHVQIYIFKPKTRQLIKQADSSQPTTLIRKQQQRISLEYDDSIIARAAQTHEMILGDGVSENSLLMSEVAVPLLSRGALLGVLYIQDEESDSFSETDLETFKTLAGQIATGLENAHLFEEIQKAEKRFRTIFEDAPIGMVILNLETYRPMQANKALYEMLGYSETQLTALTWKEISHPEEVEQNIDLFNQLTAEDISSFQIERRYLKHNQEVLWTNFRATLIRDREGGLGYCLGMIENITKRKQVETALQQSEFQYREKAQELEQALHELQTTQAQLIQTEKMSSLGQLVAGVAHEINNPVNFIYGNVTPASEYLDDLLELLYLYQQSYPEPVPEIQACTEEIELEFLVKDFQKILSSMKIGAERIRQIVLSLRNFSRLDESEMKEVNIHDGIDSTLVILQNKLKDKIDHPGIKVIKEYGDLPPVECFAGQLNQVFMNLLTNAIDAIDELNNQRPLEEIKSQPGSIWIRTRALPDSKEVEIQIVDNGIGMSTETQQKLFNPFFTTKKVGQGTGLGLAISYQIIVEKHQGQFQCISTPKKGAKFIIRIPTMVKGVARPALEVV